MFMQPQIMPMAPSMFMGILALAAGGVPILHKMKILPFTIPPVPLLLEGILAVAGILLVLDALLGFTLA